MTELLIGRIGWDHLRITLSDRWSTNWFNADVEIKCEAWAGKYTATFESGELRSFASEIRTLYQELSGTAALQQTGQQYLSITCKGDGRGHIWLDGVAKERAYDGPSLTFQFSLEQTELPSIADALEALDPRMNETTNGDTVS
jgi:hypothetical protein